MKKTQTKEEFEEWLKSRKPVPELTNEEVLKIHLKLAHKVRAKMFPDANFRSVLNELASKKRSDKS